MRYCLNLEGDIMKKIKPIGYSKSSLGISISVFIVIGSALMIFLMVKNGVPFSDMKYIAVIAAILALLFFLGDFIANRKNAEKIKRMEYLLSCPSVKGEVIEIKKIPRFLGKEITDMPKTNVKVYIKAKNAVYRICAKFHNPLTDTDEIAVSESYNILVKNEIKNNSVDVHYSPDGDIWIEV